MIHVRNEIALSLGVMCGDGCRCIFCGSSIFDMAEKKKTILRKGFSDFDTMVDPSSDDVCAGCVRILAGRPGSDPPPVRTTSFIVSDGQFITLDRQDMYSVLSGDFAEGSIISWAKGRKKHHWLHACRSSSERLIIGSDDGPVEFLPERDHIVMDAVLSMLTSPEQLSKTAILTGEYSSPAVAKHGITRWAHAESIIVRSRGTPVLDLILWATKKPDKSEIEKKNREDDMLESSDEQAAGILASLAQASEFRTQDGLRFWSTYFHRRVERFARLLLPDLVSRLMDEIKASSINCCAVIDLVKNLDPETQKEIEQSIRKRCALIVSRSYSIMKERKNS